MKWHLGRNSIPSALQGINSFILQKRPDQLGTGDYFSLALLMERLRTRKPPAQGHTAEKVWSQPSPPGSPAPLPTKLSSHQILCSQGPVRSIIYPGGELRGAERRAEYLMTCSVTQLDWSHFVDRSSLRGGFSFYRVTWPCQRDERLCTRWGMWTLRPSILKFRPRDNITFQNICCRGDGCEFFFHNESYFKFIKSY